MNSAQQAKADAPTRAPVVVLDTNACLDLFVFDDPRAAGLMKALQRGDVVAISNDACRGEWLRVLRYPQLRLDESARALAVTRFDACVGCFVGELPPERRDVRLPRCSDPDDQKFLELALAGGARWLVSRDAQVLRLGRRTRRDGLFEIVSPQAWAEALAG